MFGIKFESQYVQVKISWYNGYLCICSKKVVSQSGGVTVGVERVNGTQLTATVQYTTVELADNITIGQLTLQPAKFGVHYTGIAGSLTFPTSAVSDHKPIHCIVIIFCILFHRLQQI